MKYLKQNNIDLALSKTYGKSSNPFGLHPYESKEEYDDFYDYVQYVRDHYA